MDEVKKITDIQSQPANASRDFEIDDPKQQKIFRQLSEIDSGFASIYKANLWILKNMPFKPYKFQLMAHGLRCLNWLFTDDLGKDSNQQLSDQINNWLEQFTEENLPNWNDLDDVRGYLERETHKDKLIKRITALDPRGGLPKKVIEPIISRWVKLHIWFNGVAKKANFEESEFMNNLYGLEEILLIVTSSYFDLEKEIDEILKQQPKPENLQRLKDIFVYRRNYEYFFERVSSSWANVLLENGFFEDIDENDMMPWPPTMYLIRIASEKPKEVVDVLEKISKNTNLNSRIRDDFITVALNIDIKNACRISDIIVKNKWIQKGDFDRWAGSEIIKLFEKIYNSGMKRNVINLLRSLLSLKNNNNSQNTYKGNVVSCINEYQYNELLEKNVEKLFNDYPVGVVNLIAQRLYWFYRLDKQRDYDKNQDWSSRDYDYIDDKMGIHDDIKHILIFHLYNKLKLIGQTKPQKLQEAVKVLEKYPEKIFRMIQERIYREFDNLFFDEVQTILVDSTKYNVDTLSDDFAELLKNNFQKLVESQKQVIFSYIRNKPPIIKALEKGNKERSDRIYERWKFELLYLLPLDELPKDLLQWFNENKDEYDEPDFNRYKMKSYVGPTSPYSKEQLDEMTSEQIVDQLKNWQPPADNFMAPSPEGLGRLLSDSIKSTPEKYFTIAEQFITNKLRFDYIFHLFWGFEQALKEHKELDWESIINAGVIMTRLSDEEIAQFPKKIEKFDYGFDGSLKALVSLLDQGLGMEETIVPYERRKDVWSIILRGTQSPDPTVQHEKEYGGDNMDPFTMSINTTRGESFHALIRYSYWVNKNEDSKSLPTEVTQVLDDHLDNDPSQTIYSVYGRYFGFLYGNNSKWVKENLDRIFPDDFNNPLWKASFGTYLMSTMYADLFLILKKQYLKALSFAEAHTEEKNDGFNFTDKLSNHVAWAVAYGTDGHSEIAKELFKNKNESLKNHMIWYIGANILKPELAKIKEDEYPNPNNLKWIWEGELDNLAPDIAKNFGWWFVNSPYSRGFNIKQLVKTLKVSGGLVEPDHKILEGISTYAEEFPEEVMICLDLLVKNKDKHWPMKFRVGSYESIMDKIKPIANDSTKQKIVAVADYLGKMGFSEFKKFVQ